MKFSVQSRLTFAFTIVFAALLVLFTTVVYYFLSNGMDKKLQEDSIHDMGVLIEDLTEDEWRAEVAEMPEESDEFRLIIKIMDPNGKVISLAGGATESEWPTDFAAVTSHGDQLWWERIKIKDKPYLILSRTFRPPGAAGTHYIQIANSEEANNWILESFVYYVNLGTLLVLIVAILAGYFLSKKALRPVEESVIKMKRFVADASHELRIPLTGLRGTAEVALRQDRSKEEYRHALETIHSESERMSELVWDLLSLARADADGIQLDKNPVDISQFLHNVFEEAALLNAEKQVDLKLGQIPAGEVTFDEAKVQQLLLNLLENAIRYNKPGGAVVLSAERRKDHLLISVKDTGIGISPEDLPKIFDRFYRVDKARSREAGGTGLGLAIARSIAEAHNGTLEVRSVLNQGSEFTLTLPLA